MKLSTDLSLPNLGILIFNNVKKTNEIAGLIYNLQNVFLSVIDFENGFSKIDFFMAQKYLSVPISLI